MNSTDTSMFIPTNNYLIPRANLLPTAIGSPYLSGNHSQITTLAAPQVSLRAIIGAEQTALTQRYLSHVVDIAMAIGELPDRVNSLYFAKIQEPGFYDNFHYPLILRQLRFRAATNLAFEAFYQEVSSYDIDQWRNDELWQFTKEQWLMPLMARSAPSQAYGHEAVREWQERLLITRHLAFLISTGRMRAISDKLIRTIDQCTKLDLPSDYNPFEPVDYTSLPEEVRRHNLQWVTSHSITVPILRGLDQLRRICMDGDTLNVLHHFIQDRSHTVSSIYNTLSCAMKDARPTEVSARVSNKPSRAVIWNPYSTFDPDQPEKPRTIVLDESLGEGILLAENGDRVTVKFQDQPPVMTSKSTIIYPNDRVRYQEVLNTRITRSPELPYAYTFLALRRFLTTSEIQEFSENLENTLSNSRAETLAMLHRLAARSSTYKTTEVVPKLLMSIASQIEKLGFDPITFCMRVLIGERPYEYSKLPTDRPSSVVNKQLKNGILTSDMIREFLLTRPWLTQPNVNEALRNNTLVCSIGHLYTSYYPSDTERPNDLSDLYYAFRNKEQEAVEMVTDMMKNSVDQWVKENAATNPLIIPMIGTAPLSKVASEMGLPTLFPWLPRPADYGQGVEGMRTSVKMRVLEKALRLDPSKTAGIKGREILILDDNRTDDATFVWARKLLRGAGARLVGAVLLTRTIRHPRELDF